MTPSKIFEQLPVVVGGTGLATVSAHSIVVGNGTDPLFTSDFLTWDRVNDRLLSSNVSVSGNLTVGSRPDVEKALDDIESASSTLAVDTFFGDAIGDSNIVSRHIAGSNVLGLHIAESNVRTRHLVDGSVTAPKIADSNVRTYHLEDGAVTAAKVFGQMPVSVGGTGLSDVAQGRILVGNAQDALLTSPLLYWDDAGSTLFTSGLSASNAVVVGNLSVGARSNIEQALADIESDVAGIEAAAATGAGINDASILSRHIAASNVLEYHIADSNVRTRHLEDESVTSAKIAASNVRTYHLQDAAVTPDKIAGPVPVPTGGTGLTAVPAGVLLFGPDSGGDPLEYSGSLRYDAASANLSSSNVFAEDRVHAASNIVLGGVGATRFRFSVGGPSNDDLVISRIDENHVESSYLNLGDLVALLSNVNIYDP